MSREERRAWLESHYWYHCQVRIIITIIIIVVDIIAKCQVRIIIIIIVVVTIIIIGIIVRSELARTIFDYFQF